MNDMNQPPIDAYDDFPEVGSQPQAGEQQQKKDDRKGFQNPVFPNDSVTTCSGFINEIRSHAKDSDTLFFVRAGLIQGARRNDRGEWEGDITNCDLLVGSTLRKWAESMKQFKDPFSGIRVTFVIRNLKFTPGIYEGKPVLSSRGVLEAITIGHLDQ
ncbi:hypothetical protein B9Q17_10055 [Marinobacter vinifirmus]|uniref:Uncharacterized protein n=1 Tax=Marinobacter vinifirmus TaxID=355591 RepID=A0A7Z1IKY3_9GAMM|nr:hypothetical protein [Marinobacter vinifirmus]OZC34600.1 hypothetical protein B9Q17_10055 [Marinobacter vinifirmus]